MYTKPFSVIGKDDIRQVGGKAASLGELTQANFPVPPGFVIIAQAFHDFRNNDPPESFVREILDQFALLDSELVSVRSSALAEDSQDASWAGQMETYLNTTRDSLIDRIRDCWDSADSKRAKAYAQETATLPEDLMVAVIVQKMVNSETAGVMFTANPITGNRDELLIEAGYGLGEGIVSGLVTPDSYLLNKQDLEIMNHTISEQTVMIAYDQGQTRTVEVPQSLQDKQKLTDKTIQSLAQLGAAIEQHYASPQDIEWAFENSTLYILQSRPITTLDSAQAVTASSTDVEPITSGIGASRGIVTGSVRIIQNSQDLNEVQKGEILVTHTVTPDYVEIFPKISGIVTESGGVTNHAAVVSREMGIPAILGTQDITLRVRTGDIITIDGSGGFVYPGEVNLIPSATRDDFKIPMPSDDDIQDMIDAIVAVINNPNELWPLAPSQLMPYIETDQSVDMYHKIKQLQQQGMSDPEIAALFERPIFIKNFLLNTGITGIKAANVFEKRVTLKDQMDFVTTLLKLAKILNHNDPNYIVSQNLLWSTEEAAQFVSNTDWDEITGDLAQAINVLSVNLLTLNWSLYWNYFAETGHELHGPYTVAGFQPDSRMVVKDYFNLASGDIWEHAQEFPYNEIRLAQIYNTDKMFLSFGIRLTAEELAAHNTHCALFVDGKRVTNPEKIREISLEAKKMADRQIKLVNDLDRMDKVRKGAKISYFARKKFYSHFDKEWYPKATVEGTIKALGSKLIDKQGNPKPSSLEYKKIIWDPRTDIFPDDYGSV